MGLGPGGQPGPTTNSHPHRASHLLSWGSDFPPRCENSQGPHCGSLCLKGLSGAGQGRENKGKANISLSLQPVLAHTLHPHCGAGAPFCPICSCAQNHPHPAPGSRRHGEGGAASTHPSGLRRPPREGLTEHLLCYVLAAWPIPSPPSSQWPYETRVTIPIFLREPLTKAGKGLPEITQLVRHRIRTQGLKSQICVLILARVTVPRGQKLGRGPQCPPQGLIPSLQGKPCLVGQQETPKPQPRPQQSLTRLKQRELPACPRHPCIQES